MQLPKEGMRPTQLRLPVQQCEGTKGRFFAKQCPKVQEEDVRDGLLESPCVVGIDSLEG